jgi:hypothetical protein
MAEQPQTPQDILPAVRCSGNLRRRTGVWMGLSAWEIMVGLCACTIPDFLYRLGILAKPNLLAGILLSAGFFGFCLWFRRNKPPNYFALWFYHHFGHPKAWRASRIRTERNFPLLED